MTPRSDDESDDKARERLRQFEAARSPQPAEEELLDGLEELIEQLRAAGGPLTDRAAERLERFRDAFVQQRGFRQDPPPDAGEEGAP